MPTYESKCKQCDKVYTYTARPSNYVTEAPMCCGKITKRHFTAASIPMVNSVSARVMDAYQCPVTDQIVTNQKQKKYIEDSNDLIIKESGMSKVKRGKKKHQDHLPDVLKPELEKELARVNSDPNY